MSIRGRTSPCSYLVLERYRTGLDVNYNKISSRAIHYPRHPQLQVEPSASRGGISEPLKHKVARPVASTGKTIAATGRILILTSSTGSHCCCSWRTRSKCSGGFGGCPRANFTSLLLPAALKFYLISLIVRIIVFYMISFRYMLAVIQDHQYRLVRVP